MLGPTGSWCGGLTPTLAVQSIPMPRRECREGEHRYNERSGLCSSEANPALGLVAVGGGGCWPSLFCCCLKVILPQSCPGTCLEPSWSRHDGTGLPAVRKARWMDKRCAQVKSAESGDLSLSPHHHPQPAHSLSPLPHGGSATVGWPCAPRLAPDPFPPTGPVVAACDCWHPRTVPSTATAETTSSSGGCQEVPVPVFPQFPSPE